MSTPDPDDPEPCVGSGFCCKKVPCPYGERDPATGWCIHLEPWKDDTLDVPRYRCGRYEFIQTQPGSEWIPAFGAGCCSSLFNEDRDRIVIELRRRGDPGAPKLGAELFTAALQGRLPTRPRKT